MLNIFMSVKQYETTTTTTGADVLDFVEFFSKLLHLTNFIFGKQMTTALIGMLLVHLPADYIPDNEIV
jgi:hypothetical protein